MNLSTQASTRLTSLNPLPDSDLQPLLPGTGGIVPGSPTKDWREFDPIAYLNEYYDDLGEENLAILRFYVEVFHDLAPKSTMLDFGSGPTIYSSHFLRPTLQREPGKPMRARYFGYFGTLWHTEASCIWTAMVGMLRGPLPCWPL